MGKRFVELGSSRGYGYDYGYYFSSGAGRGDGGGYDLGGSFSSGDGYGYSSIDGLGYGEETLRKEFWLKIKDKLEVGWVLKEEDTEVKRELIEAMGADNFFKQSKGTIVHKDTDAKGNERALLRIPIEDAESGYLQAVRVTCPTTGRVYYLGVPPEITTCQEAVASTFGMKPEQYKPIRET